MTQWSPLFSHLTRYSIESDPAFVNVGSEEFFQIFVHHEMPAISNIATILLSIADKELILQDVQREIDQLREEQKQKQRQELDTATPGNEMRVLSVMIWLTTSTDVISIDNI